MKLALMSLLYSAQGLEEASRLSRDGVQNQINAFQWGLVNGMRECLGKGGSLSVINSLPVGAFPLRYRGAWLNSRVFGDNMREIGGPNIPLFKQLWREKAAAKLLCKWLGEDENNRDILVYTLYLPYMKAVARAKRRFPGLRAYIIVTDLPNELGIASYRHGLLKRVEYMMGKKRLDMCDIFDGFVLFSRHMAEALPIGGKPFVVVEGLIEKRPPVVSYKGIERFREALSDERPAVLYTGTMNRELGIGELLEAFKSPKLAGCRLWLCGGGDMESAVKKAANGNISYFGIVPRECALMLQQRAALLINPRSAGGEYTKYSFPSKTLEYLASGRPVLCHRLEGIPEEYDDHLTYLKGAGAEAIVEGVTRLLALPKDELDAMGRRGREFARSNKSAAAQSARILSLIRDSYSNV